MEQSSILREPVAVENTRGDIYPQELIVMSNDGSATPRTVGVQRKVLGQMHPAFAIAIGTKAVDFGVQSAASVWILVTS